MQRSGTPLGLGLQGAFQSEAAGGGVRGGGPAMRINKKVRGPGWSPPPMGFGIRILITGANLYGGVYKLRFLIR